VEEARTVLKELRVAGRVLHIRAPAEPERLLDAIDAASFREDERMPYWAELWPAATAFAGRILAGDIELAGHRVLELGSGLGLVGIAAALAGAGEVTFSDYFPEALAFSAENAARNGVAGARTRLLDWRTPSLDRRYTTVLGADLLYETRNLDPVLGAIEAALEDGGSAYMADPDRITASAFGEKAERCGFTVRKSPLGGGAPGWIYRLRRASWER
jgi:predicted nicotinamide N-methyase